MARPVQTEPKTPVRPPILDLGAIVERQPVQLNGHIIGELLSIDELGALDYKRLERDLPRIQQLWNQETLTPADEQEFSAILDRFCRLVLSASEDAQRSLTDLKRLEIAKAFIARSPQPPVTSTQKPAASRSNGQPSSRG